MSGENDQRPKAAEASPLDPRATCLAIGDLVRPLVAQFAIQGELCRAGRIALMAYNLQMELRTVSAREESLPSGIDPWGRAVPQEPHTGF